MRAVASKEAVLSLQDVALSALTRKNRNARHLRTAGGDAYAPERIRNRGVVGGIMVVMR